LQKQIKELETVCDAATGGKVFPLFSQVKSVHGSISCSDPRIFGLRGAVPASTVLHRELRQFIPNEDRSLDILESLTGDRALKKDLRQKGKFIIGGEPMLAGLDHADVLISIAIGLSNAALCKRFLIDVRRASILREFVVRRYTKLFEWLDQYKKKVISAGFATLGERRKYWDGLGSSDMGKRNRAVQSAVRWLIEM
jgi:DNA polymerase I-like protein with 3'-5' exonuclease and polymerase domains